VCHLDLFPEKNRNRFDFKGKTVLEVGAGCGVSSLVLANLGATVVATDIGKSDLSLSLCSFHPYILSLCSQVNK
jgi:2-polyprenyl-3-methyl-5-hydroxy-6-metoxy-1,4-benzoquinol methylase